MKAVACCIAGDSSHLRHALTLALAAEPFLPVRTLVHVGITADLPTTVQRCQHFADAIHEREEALIVSILHAADGTDRLFQSMQVAGLWAFTRHAALRWASRRIRVNVVGLGLCPGLPTDFANHESKTAYGCTTVADIVRTIRAIASFASMTGQIVCLEGLGAAEAPRIDVSEGLTAADANFHPQSA